MFLSIDGGDGTGKSTQIRLLVGWLRERGCAVSTCRDPGSTPLGEAIREILLLRDDVAIHRRSEMLLYMAARAQLVEQTVRPALDRGETIVCDRYLLANVVYQGHAGGLDVETLWQVGRVATGGLVPRLTLVLDLPAEAAARRLAATADRDGPDRMERQGLEFHRRVRAGFLSEAARDPARYVVIDAAPEVEQVQQRIREAVARVL
jgi:dTMP kinase